MAADRPTACLMLAGQAEPIFNGELMNRDRLLLFGEGTELCTVLPPGCSWITFQLSQEELAGLGMASVGRGFSHLPLPEATADQLRSRLLGGLESVEFTDTPPLQTSASLWDIQDLLLSTFANSQTGKLPPPRLSPGPRRRSDRNVAQNMAEYMRCHIGDADLRIIDICQRLGYSIKTAERSFLKTYAMPPKTYLTLVRLSELKRKIMAGETEERTLSELYLDCGLAHFGRVSTQYKTLFGERPSDTSKMLQLHA
ncbi:helix-turn-helix domain-containing protein [Roseovarius sp. C7]|uniref:helix-turn-helix domain-containing protein n=1 Tax=Roseovarius sp. C7 TaxID=3398643 RepID=UPI0039F5DFEF